MKASVLLFLWLSSILFHNSSCSSAVGVDNTAPNSSSRQTAQNQIAGNVADQSSATVESNSSQNPRDVVLFDGENYIKKSGWKVPSRKEAFIDESTEGRSPRDGRTRTGKQVKTTTTQFIYKTPWHYSQDFYFDGPDLDYMEGNLEAEYFLEISVNDKVFMYMISGRKIVPPPTSNSYHEDPFVYEIQDNNGDGIFETLVGGKAFGETIVPNWVLK